MSTGPAWRVFKTVSLRSQLYVPPSARRDPATLIECCVRVLGANVQAQYKRIKLLPYEVQDFVFECAREEGLLSVPQLVDSVQPHTCSLNLSKYSSQVTDVGLAEVSAKSFDLGLIVPRLEALPEQGISDWEEVTSCSVATAMRGCPNLTSLNISNCTSVSLHSLQSLLALPLQKLIIAHTGFCQDTNKPILLRSNSIRYLDISGTEQEFDLRHLVALEELRLGERKSSTLDTIRTVMDARELRVLDLSGTRYAAGNQIRFERTMVPILASLRKLRSLVLRQCHFMDETYVGIVMQCKGLRSLDLSRSTVSMPTVNNIIAGAHALDELDITECRDIVNPEPVLLHAQLLRPQMSVRFMRYLK